MKTFLIQTDLPWACAIGLLRLVEIAKNDQLFIFDRMCIQDKNLLDIGMMISSSGRKNTQEIFYKGAG